MKAGHLHSQVIAANMRSMMPVLLQHGYGTDDLETLLETCHAEVSLSLCLMYGSEADRSKLTGPGSTYYQRLFAVYATKIR